MRRFPIPAPDPGARRVCLSVEDSRHLLQVLRMGVGATVRLYDGQGTEYDGRVEDVQEGVVRVAIAAASASQGESPLNLILLQGFLKEGKMDLLVRQTTELGITQFVPVFGRRSVSRPEGRRLQVRIQRWEKIASEALKQCRRGRVPAIGPPCMLAEALRMTAACDLKIAFWEEGGLPLKQILAAAARPLLSAALLLGPEGGFEAAEMASAQESGFVLASLGPRILRAETATVAACALVQYGVGDLSAPAAFKA